VQARYASVQHKWKSAEAGRRFNQFRRPKYLFSGLTKRGECGAGFITYSREQLGCFGARARGTCTNLLTIPRQAVEQRVLCALQDKLMPKDFFDEFCREFAKAAAIGDRDELVLDLARQDALHSTSFLRRVSSRASSRLADVWPKRCSIRSRFIFSRQQASEMLRGLIESIVLTPESGPAKAGPHDSRAGNPGEPHLRIGLGGNLAAMLAVAQKTTRSPETGDLVMPVQMVAGARNQRYLQLWSGAA
jgi:hypothetical protein